MSENTARDGTLATDLSKVSCFGFVVVVVGKSSVESFCLQITFLFMLKIKAVWGLRERIAEALMFCGTVYKVILSRHQ